MPVIGLTHDDECTLRSNQGMENHSSPFEATVTGGVLWSSGGWCRHTDRT